GGGQLEALSAKPFVERRPDGHRVAPNSIFPQSRHLGTIMFEPMMTSSPRTSAADLKFLQRLPQVRVGTSNRKAALEP
ncbi:MAG: hypothetical protein ACJ8DQ_21670, partial [Xanthobacteraceae bacterium]